jgi:hypothetical protein
MTKTCFVNYCYKMTYKNTVALALAVFMIAAAAPASANPGNPRLLNITVNKMFQYATTLYDRNNEPEGIRVLNRILELDPNYGPALAKLHKKAPRKKIAIDCCEFPPIGPVALSNEDLKKEIQAEDKAIHGLHQEIARLQSETEENSQ